ncbi:hypothetical protein C8J57DRAFT_1614313 [Mycena rebaudengoi]|nr:hypothetical protein C8J57DRAFT_1614313 [Mycena rebaudengoi]
MVCSGARDTRERGVSKFRERALGPRREEDAVPAPHASSNRTHNTTTPSHHGRAWWAQDAGVGRQRIAEEHISRTGTQRRCAGAAEPWNQTRNGRGFHNIGGREEDADSSRSTRTRQPTDTVRDAMAVGSDSQGSVLNVRERALEPWWCTGRTATLDPGTPRRLRRHNRVYRDSRRVGPCAEEGDAPQPRFDIQGRHCAATADVLGGAVCEYCYQHACMYLCTETLNTRLGY